MERELVFPGATGQTEVVVDDECAAVVLDPLRWRILKSLGSGRSVAELSKALGVTDARISYHLQRLSEAGVVRLDPASDPRTRRAQPIAGRLRVRQAPASQPAPRAMPDDVVSDFDQALRELAEGMFGQACQMSISHNRSRLSEAQAAEFNRRLSALIEEYFPPGKGDRTGIKYGFYAVFTPIDLHPFDG